MESNGLTPFTFHRHDRPEVAAELRPIRGLAPSPTKEAPTLASLDAETAARRYLDKAFASPQLPTFNPIVVQSHTNEFRTLGAEALPLTGTTMVKFRQLFGNIPVYGSLVTIELDEKNELLTINASRGEPSGLNPVAKQSPAQALKVVESEAGYTDGSLKAVPTLQYYFDAKNNQWHLAYTVENVPSQKSKDPRAPALFDYVVDAHTGAMVAVLPRTQGMEFTDPYEPRRRPWPASFRVTDIGCSEAAVDELGKEREFRCKLEQDRIVLVDEDYNIHTHDARFRDIQLDSRTFPGDYVTLPPRPWSAAGISAHANATEVARFLREVLKRNSLDNQGGRITSSINCCYRSEGKGQEWRNAAWIRSQMAYGQRMQDDKLISYATALDVVAHEIIHGLTEHTARLWYKGESGALNESYSDIFGIIVSNFREHDVRKWDWQMGEELEGTGLPIRDLSSPKRCKQPEHMEQYEERSSDFGGVHFNSGIHNRAAYLLLTAADASGRPLLKPKEVAALFYITLTQHLSPTSRFSDSRRGMEVAARTLFRNDPALEEKLKAVARAFDTVGIPSTEIQGTIDAAETERASPALSTEAQEITIVSVAPKLHIPYSADFLGDGFQVPLPKLTGRTLDESFSRGQVVGYVHFSLTLHERRRTALYTACNIDAAHMVRLGRQGLPWMLDPRIPAKVQLGPAYYAGNEWDRGHLVRRQDPIWGPVSEARRANEATFYFTNAAPQHANFNQDEWLVLEDWVLERAADFSYRLCVFTGPVLSDDDPPLRDAQIPAGFWKVVVLRDATAGGADLSVVAFFMKQTEMLHDKLGKKLLQLKRYQVTLQAIEAWTGLDFGALKDADELAWAPAALRAAVPAESYRRLTGPQDLVFSGDRRRAAGRRILPLKFTGTPQEMDGWMH
ncbi:DNA/RNA non-specific endonuclease [Myxococcus xanthus]|uniref:DNA/RNA non-specific endonuclease n=1 Tax=Myxococcus xanthus TaxID=34 RepID=UPI00112ADA25|nr:DNA/RNA non-specific endonuclease [Myxococcus xanthus]